MPHDRPNVQTGAARHNQVNGCLSCTAALNACRVRADESPVGPAGRRTFACLLARLRHEESGFGLIEVVVSSMLLVLVASGVYLGLDAASATSGVNKHRTMAAAIAQQDQDRMRAMAVSELSNYHGTSTSRVGAVTYTVRSNASWVTDKTGTPGCASEVDPRFLPSEGSSAGSAAHYLRIASSVTWPSMRVQPVTIESIVAPPAGSFGTNLGSLAVHVRDRNGDGVAGVSVALAGPQSDVALTNAQGCVLWGYLPIGDYFVTLTKQGYVDKDGVAQPRKETDVVGEGTMTVAFDYDLGGYVQANFETLAGGVPTPASWPDFSAVNARLALPMVTFDGGGAPVASIRSAAVFPFTDPYGVFAGRCSGARPADADVQLALVEPGGTTPVAVRLPPIELQALSGGSPVAGAVARFTATGSGCNGTTTRTTGRDGFLTERGLPYGTYAVCVQAGTRRLLGTVDNSAPTGVPAADARYDMTLAPTGTCP